MTVTLNLTETPTSDELAAIGDSLAAFNAADAGEADRRPLVITLTDETGAFAGGLSGFTAWGWLYIQWLFVSEGLRGQGWAPRLLEAAEAEARTRGCHGAHIDTFSPIALKTYQRAGYTIFGELHDFPKGRTRSFLQKQL
jgi:GNAT superfamily N-acetyltransferase